MVTGSLSLVTAALTHRWSEQARLRADREQETRATRDQKREACHNYLVATNLFYQAVDQVYLRASRNEQFDQREHVRAAITALQDAYVYLTISSGADVRKLARDYNMVLYELEKAAQRADHDKWSELERETHRARRHLREAMRVELGVQDLAVRYTSDIVAAIGTLCMVQSRRHGTGRAGRSPRCERVAGRPMRFILAGQSTYGSHRRPGPVCALLSFAVAAG